MKNSFDLKRHFIKNHKCFSSPGSPEYLFLIFCDIFDELGAGFMVSLWPWRQRGRESGESDLVFSDFSSASNLRHQ